MAYRITLSNRIEPRP